MKRLANPVFIALAALFIICLGTLIFTVFHMGKDDTQAVSPITDFQESDPQRYEPIVPWTAEDGEVPENPYYKRMTDEDGRAVYAVQRASDNQAAYLPIDSTVLYTGGEASYYEELMLSYTQDGEKKEITQYQLHIGDE